MTDEKPEECDGCEYQTQNLTFYAAEYAFNGHPMRRAAWLCELCAPTACGQAAVSVMHNTYTELKPVTSTICYVGNAILEELRRRA